MTLPSELTDEQLKDIRKTFDDFGRTGFEADWIITRIQIKLKELALGREVLASLLAQWKRGGAASIARDIRQLNTAITSTASALGKRHPLAWWTVAGITIEELSAAVSSLARLRERLSGREESLRATRARLPRGERRDYLMRLLLQGMAEEFLTIRLPVVTTQDRLFVSVARIVHPMRPNTVTHELLLDAIKKARQSLRRRPLLASPGITLRDWFDHAQRSAAPKGRP
jgi:hypothetical protein